LGSQVVKLPYADPRDRIKVSQDLLHAVWGSIDYEENAEIAVLLPLEKIAHFKPGIPIGVTSDEHAVEIIRHLVAQVARVEAPGGVPDAVDSLSKSPDPPLAGYLYTHLTWVENRDKPDIESTLLGKMIGSPSVPPSAWNAVTQDSVFNYFRTSQIVRLELIKLWLDLAQVTDTRIAVPAFNALEVATHFDPSPQTMVGSADLAELAAAYRTLVRNGSLQRSATLEAGFGIQY
jgi:hypothetical protein